MVVIFFVVGGLVGLCFGFEFIFLFEEGDVLFCMIMVLFIFLIEVVEMIICVEKRFLMVFLEIKFIVI